MQSGSPPPSPRSVDTSVLDRARRRDPQAIAEMYECFSAPVYSYLLHQLRDVSDAEDVLETTFVEVLEGIHAYSGTADSLRAWVFQIARRNVLDHLRSSKRHPTVPLDESLAQVTDATSSPDPQELALERIRRQALREAIDRLAPDQREVLLLRLGSGLTGPEIAEATGRSVGAVKALQHRALVALSRMLSPNEPGASRTPEPGGGALNSGSD